MVDAILLRNAPTLAVAHLLPYVLSMTRTCPCGDTWIISLNEPLALEVELGMRGQTHLVLLQQSMKLSCSAHENAGHLRTNGETVWPVL